MGRDRVRLAGAHLSPGRERRIRAWLEYVVEASLAVLDHLDAAAEDLEDDEREDDGETA